MHRFTRRFSQTAGTAALAAAILAPASASAAQNYVVTLAPPAGVTCEATIQAVAATHSLTPKYTYTSALCGFSASVPKRTVESLRVDFRVSSVELDGSASSF